MHQRLTELLDYLDAERARVLHAGAALPADRWTVRPASDRWSVSEVYWHLQRVEQGIAALVRKRVAQARASGHPEESESASVLHSLDGRGITDRSKRLAAPSQIAPETIPDAETVRQQLAESRALLRAAIAEADGLALGSIKHTHPVLGEIDLYQWILFVGQHEARHAEQIAESVAEVSRTD
jgi:uncharacterized damage-inducible protein DinB